MGPAVEGECPPSLPTPAARWSPRRPLPRALSARPQSSAPARLSWPAVAAKTCRFGSQPRHLSRNRIPSPHAGQQLPAHHRVHLSPPLAPPAGKAAAKPQESRAIRLELRYAAVEVTFGLDLDSLMQLSGAQCYKLRKCTKISTPPAISSSSSSCAVYSILFCIS